jgi:hypothetical protein
MSSAATGRLAWRILIAAFGIFILICAATTYVTQWFIFQSTIPLELLLSPSQGTTRVILRDTQTPLAITSPYSDLSVGVNVQTDSNSQSELRIISPDTGQLLAMVTLFPDTQITIREASTARYSINLSPDVVELSISSGHLFVEVGPGFSNERLIVISQPQIGSFSTRQAGQYSLIATSTSFQASTLEGAGDIEMAGNNAPISSGEEGTANINSASFVFGRHNIITGNPSFESDLPSTWSPYSLGEPNGSVSRIPLDGGFAILIDRSQSLWPNTILDHGESGITQQIEANVTGFQALTLMVKLKIEEQSLSACGIVGSECPLMIRIEYVDPIGVSRTSIHGFYSVYDSTANFPLICDTCRAPHERINLGSWFMYSVNLFTHIQADQRPVHIRSIDIYASGHAYRVYIASVLLIGSE